MVFAFHQLQCLCSVFVVKLECLFHCHIALVGKASLQLDQGYDAVVHDALKLRVNPFIDKRLTVDFQAPDAVCLNQNLVCERRGSHNTPCRSVVFKFVCEQLAAFCQLITELLVGMLELI